MFYLTHSIHVALPISMSSKAGPVWTNVVHVSERAMLKPLGWRKPRFVFVNSMSDTFHEAVPDSVIARIWAMMALTPHNTYPVLTKRHERTVARHSGPGTDRAAPQTLPEHGRET